MVSVLALSVTFGATSPKERGLDSPFAIQKRKFSAFKGKFHQFRADAKNL